MKPGFDPSLYLVLDPVLCEPLGMVETTRRAVAGGVTMVQLRDKTASTAAMIETGRALKQVLAGSGVPLIINDDVEAAIACGADGVHVGQGDMAAGVVRQRIGSDMILGLSVTSLALAEAATSAPVDYLGIGPVLATGTKPDHAPVMGFDGLVAAIRAVSVPVVAIGGLKHSHIEAVFQSGAKGIAVVSAICGTLDPEKAARDLAQTIRSIQP